MKNVTLIGIVLGKHSFHVHCQDEKGNALLRRKFSRSQLFNFLSSCQVATVVMESCGGAHYMARRIAGLGRGASDSQPAGHTAGGREELRQQPGLCGVNRTGSPPVQHGGKTTLMGISKRGDKNLRRLLVQCARVFMQRLEHNPGRLAGWVTKQLTSHHSNVVACALANKLARIARAVTVHQAVYSK